MTVKCITDKPISTQNVFWKPKISVSFKSAWNLIAHGYSVEIGWSKKILSCKKGHFMDTLAPPIKNVNLCHLMQNKLSTIGAELEKDRCRGIEIRALNGTKN